ncbi:hypothetical protein GCM10010512_46250 [Streptomyces thermoviolaceus subsp. thermoviolaceus]|nr:hypothetical protein GCM10010499_27210 [Streptomyces thermoviolaceus subsp. apingens]GHB09499.1 hypothetical protein GCM10010512_46250 [Streptomyces thermoviolaceus subsp. thermoviolaceus]
MPRGSGPTGDPGGSGLCGPAPHGPSLYLAWHTVDQHFFTARRVLWLAAARTERAGPSRRTPAV